MTAQNGTQTRHAQIDGLRALAMTGVLYVHFWNRDPLSEGLRVALFFTVSGFLITHILLAAKRRDGRVKILNFYIRRALRLFPALFILGALAFAFDMDGTRASWPWHVAQASNIYFAKTEAFSPWIFSHLWSLNTLEQFYLLWPLVIVFLPMRAIFGVTIALLLLSVFISFFGADIGINAWWRQLVFRFGPIACGVLAYLLIDAHGIPAFFASLKTLCLAIGVMFSPLVFGAEFGESALYGLLAQLALAVVVIGAWKGYGGGLGRVLESRPARYISKISYGIFVYHLGLWWMMAQLQSPLYDTGPLPFFAMSALSVLAASLSWVLIEAPLARLKTRFPTLEVQQPEQRPAQAQISARQKGEKPNKTKQKQA